MATNKFDQQKSKNISKTLKKEGIKYLNIPIKKIYIYKSKDVFSKIHLFLSIYFLFLFQYSLQENKIIVGMPATPTEVSNQKVINLITNVESMKVAGKTVTVATDPPSVINNDGYDVEIVFKTPLKDCSKLFNGVSKAISIDMTDFDSSECTTFNMMFYKANGFKEIKIGSKFLTGQATNFVSMFYSFGANGCKHNFGFHQFDTSQATTMNQMFYGSCFKFLDLSSFDTSNVSNMEKMFYQSKAISLDLSSFDTSKVTTMGDMFAEMKAIISLEISNFNFDSCTRYTHLFYNMNGVLKFCPNTKVNAEVQAQITEAQKTAKCNDPCFINEENKFTSDSCVTSCLDTSTKFDYNNQCLAKCPDGTAEVPAGSYICVDVLTCKKKFISYDMTECLDSVPDGYYCNDEEKRTIDICPEICKTCNLTSVNANLCIACNNDNFYYHAENYIDNTDKYVACFQSAPEGYYLDLNANLFKKCYQSCKTCDELGDDSVHKCTSCKDNLIAELESNCYEVCPTGEYYYFDESNVYTCSDSCPEGYNKIDPKMKCSKDCRNEPPYIYEFEGECLDACPELYHAPNDDKKCVVALQCDIYYNYEYTACLDEIPEGFFCNNTDAKTIDKCNIKCKTCTFESVKNNLCTQCSTSGGYYKKEDDSVNTDEQIQCYNILPENYFLDEDDNIYKRCYKTCKYCDSLGTHPEHLCTECPDGYTMNGTSNCYEICDYHYYFDENMEYHCTKNESCPQEKSKLIVEKNECVEACVGDFRFEFEDKCYRACPPQSFYNFEQTNCIGEVPEGYYENETQIIDKCFSKCKTCILDSVKDNHCSSCNNDLFYYQKENEASVNQYYDCYTGSQDGYYLDLINKEYKQCHKTCKSCDEKGDIINNKCTQCFSNSTLNGTNCFEICKYYHFFDDPGEYHCTQDNACPTDRNKLIVATHECVKECTGEYRFEFDDKCYTECPPETYYNFTQTGCIGSIPSGYYMNDSLKRTIEKCDVKCEKNCILDFPTNNVICESCNNAENYYKKEDGEIIDGYYDCFTGSVETYYLDDVTDKEYKKCYVTCLFCSELGDPEDHKCTACSSQYTQNGTFCFLNCPYYHYFDTNKVYKCTEGEECPRDFPNLIVGEKSCVKDCPNKLIVDKKECVDECTGQYRFEFDDKCYTECPPETYYNFTQTGCIGSIPSGYYMNDSLKRTIEKCDVKCEKNCILNVPTNNVICEACNNAGNYYKKEDGEIIGGYYDCFTGPVETYYLDDITDKEYKKCYESCKFCTKKGNITEHKCTACPYKYTLNGTFCYEICDYFYYFDDNDIYHCTENQDCVSIAPNKVVERKACVKDCVDEEIYKFVYNSRCYKKCPIYFNYEQTGCIGEIPDGFYANDSEARTIDKCMEKCEKCNTESVSKDQCITCNNGNNFFMKENDDKNFANFVNCYTSLVEGYYLDQEEKKYKKCFEKCKNCDGKGIITEHKCTECHPDFTLNGTNCYEICPYYYYFDTEGIYHCTVEEKCPFKYNLIPEKRQCIDDCKNDDVYNFTHRGICLDHEYIPQCNDSSMYIERETGDCAEECDAIDFLFNYCGLRNNIPLNQDQVVTMLIEAIENGTLSGYIQEILEGKSRDYLVMEDSITYHLTTLKENNLLSKTISNVSSIDLGDCENKLRDKYNIDSNLDLIILKIDYYVNYSLIPVIGYEVFHPITQKKLDLSVCQNNVLNINVPTQKLNESIIYIYDPDSAYYTDKCNPTTIETNYDIILSDRQNYFISNNLSICENNCVLKEYDTGNKQSICTCNIKSFLLTSSEIHNKSDLFFTEFSTSEGSSTNSLKCASTLFSKDGIIKNIAFYIYLILLIALIICCIQFYRKGFSSLKAFINQILLIREKKTEEGSQKMENMDDLSDNIDKNTLRKILNLRTPKNTKIDFRGAIAKDDINYQDNYSNNQKSLNKLEIYNFRRNDDNFNYHLETEKEIVYSEFEINSFTYKQAIGVDMRTFKQIYISFVKFYHPILFLCNKTKDYNSIYIKFSLILISFSLHYFVNSLFISKSILHEIYETGNTNNIGKFIPYIIISFIICYILDKVIRYISLSDNNIYSVYTEALFNNAKIRARKVKNLLLIKYITFYTLGLISILIFGYYLATFGAVYQNTQFILIKNVLMSYAISLVFPFIIIVLPSMFRRFALKDATRQCMFNFSRILQYL